MRGLGLAALAAALVSSCVTGTNGADASRDGSVDGGDASREAVGDAARDGADHPPTFDAPVDMRRDGADAGAANGATCLAASSCRSGFCQEGVCCDRDCSSSCGSCVFAGTIGICTPSPAQTTCATSACVGTSFRHGSRCDGRTVTCPAPVLDACGGYLCDPVAGCRTSCTDSAGCTSDSRCVKGACVFGGRYGGDVCTSAAQCLSGNCAGGMCCDLPCGGPCQSCTLPGHQGSCTYVSAGTLDAGCRPYTCGAAGCLTSCASASDCDGLPCQGGVCGLADGTACSAGTACASGRCTGGLCCNSSCADPCGSCALPGSLGRCSPKPKGTAAGACGSYTCDGAATTCPTACSDDSVCAAGTTCVAGRCAIRNGAPCTSGAVCASGVCNVGICCDALCSGYCRSCTAPGSTGTCVFIQGRDDPASGCSGDFTCNSQGMCVHK